VADFDGLADDERAGAEAVWPKRKNHTILRARFWNISGRTPLTFIHIPNVRDQGP
jgi:hypothetical protein